MKESVRFPPVPPVFPALRELEPNSEACRM